MGEVITTRFRSLWIVSAILPFVAGGASAVVEGSVHSNRACSTGGGSGVLYGTIFVLLAFAPGAIVGLVGWRSRRSAADTVGPFCLAMCLSVFLVFIGLAAVWGGQGCMT